MSNYITRDLVSMCRLFAKWGFASHIFHICISTSSFECELSRIGLTHENKQTSSASLVKASVS
jgi:hypothetical protein